MTEKEFLKKNNLDLEPEEILLADDAVSKMKNAKDVHHGLAHIYSLFDYFHAFIQSPDFQAIKPKPNLKVIFFSILCHDCWRATKDPNGALGLLWYTIYENFGNTRLFLQMARHFKINHDLMKKVKYCIKKDGWFTLFPLKTIESKVHKSLDEWNQFDENRIGIIERKFLLDRTFRASYVRQAKLAMKLFIEPTTSAARYFPWIENKINLRKQVLIPRLKNEISEYESLLKLQKNGQYEEYRKSLQVFKEKVLKN